MSIHKPSRWKPPAPFIDENESADRQRFESAAPRYCEPQHAGEGRLRRAQTSAQPSVPLLVRLRDAFRTWYRTELERSRRGVEEDARRLGGRVLWDQPKENP